MINMYVVEAERIGRKIVRLSVGMDFLFRHHTGNLIWSTNCHCIYYNHKVFRIVYLRFSRVTYTYMMLSCQIIRNFYALLPIIMKGLPVSSSSCVRWRYNSQIITVSNTWTKYLHSESKLLEVGATVSTRKNALSRRQKYIAWCLGR